MHPHPRQNTTFSGLSGGQEAHFAAPHRFSFNGQARTNEIAGTGNHTTALYWEYDTRLGRRWNVDPAFGEKPWMSPYHAFSNKPILNVDPNGDSDSPIYDEKGDFLGTDDQGLKGKAIVMKKEDFTQGMKHSVALKKDLAPKGGNEFLKAIPNNKDYAKFYKHFSSLAKRPDYDGYLTKEEADKHWLGKSGQPLFVDQAKIDLPGVNTKSFGNKPGAFFFKNFVWGLSNTGKVYGTLKLTLVNCNTGEVHIGPSTFMDKYDYKMDGRALRDFATWWGRPGGENDGKSFYIYGYGHTTVPISK